MSSNRRTAQNPPGVAEPLKSHYSNCVRVEAGPLLFLSGQVSVDADGNLVGKGDIQAQAKQVFENLRVQLEANGASMADMLKLTVFVKDISTFHSLSDLRLSYFPSNGPASTIVEISNLAWPEFLIEVEAVAAVP
jgi:enamine deaminase RidA (YjgF/YER057c/UK114 family)